MSIVTLISDWGYRDHYIGSVKGMLYRLIPDVNIVDITHEIALHDIIHASFVLKNSYHSFPENTIHIIAVDADGNGIWDVDAPDAEDISDVDKGNRILPDVEFEVTLAGAIHEVSISGVLQL